MVHMFFSSKILHDFGSPGEYEFPHPGDFLQRAQKMLQGGGTY